MHFLVKLNALQLSEFFSPSFCGFHNDKLVFLILKNFQYGEQRQWVQLFLSSSYKHWYKNWYLHIKKAYDHQIWRTNTSKGVDSNDSNQTDAGDLIFLRLSVKLKTLYMDHHSAYGHQTWQDRNLPWWAPTHNVSWPFGHVVLLDHVTS